MTVASLKEITLQQVYSNFLPPNAEKYAKLRKLILEYELPRELLEELVKLHWGNLFFLYLRYPSIDSAFICKMLELGALIGDQWSKMRVYYMLKNESGSGGKYNNLLDILNPYVNVDISYIYNNLFDYYSNENKFNETYILEKKRLINEMFTEMYTYYGIGDIYKSTFERAEILIKSTDDEVYGGVAMDIANVRDYLNLCLVQYLDSSHTFHDVNLQILSKDKDSVKKNYSADMILFIFQIGNIYYLDELNKAFDNKIAIDDYFPGFKFSLNMNLIEYYFNNLYVNKKITTLRNTVWLYSNILDKMNVPSLISGTYNELIIKYKKLTSFVAN